MTYAIEGVIEKIAVCDLDPIFEGNKYNILIYETTVKVIPNDFDILFEGNKFDILIYLNK